MGKLKDLTGHKFGKWTVLERYSSSSKHTKFLCRCECGLEKAVYSTHLLRGNSKSCNDCGSYKNGIEHVQFKGHEGIPLDWWNSHILRRRKSKKRQDIKVSISIEYAWQLFLKQNKKCALTGLDIVIANRRNKQHNTASLDRIDSSIGYVEGNVQWLHKDINMLKNIYDQDYFIKMCKLVADYNIKKLIKWHVKYS